MEHSTNVPTTAVAHPNIALIKYWGKAQGELNVPATPSLSITLDTLSTRTQVRRADRDRIILDGVETNDAKISGCVAALREIYAIPPIEIDTRNNFPTASGLASSASGFAALVTAIDHEFELGMDAATRSEFARRGSGSAARSIHGGFVALSAPDWQAHQVLAEQDWALEVVVAITTTARKEISSSEGMRKSMDSPFYAGWVSSTRTDYAAGVAAVAARDFEQLAELAEHSCLKMHGLMLATRPGLIYWNSATIACLHAIRELRASGTPVFFTVDAGSQVKAICAPGWASDVANRLRALPGVIDTLVTGLGAGARIVDHETGLVQ
jgi:diphosphomevalonate decarboxylase